MQESGFLIVPGVVLTMQLASMTCGTFVMDMALHGIMAHIVVSNSMWAVGTSTCPWGQGSRKPVDMYEIMRMDTTPSNNKHIAVIMTNIMLCTVVWAIRARKPHPAGRLHLKPRKPENR
jgi:hypothetical protein